VTDSETEVSIVYSFAATRWLFLQPRVSYYIDPGTDPALDNALVYGFRVGVIF
jgi:porin